MFDPNEIHRLPLFRTLSRARLMEAMAAFVPSEVGPGQILMVEGEADRSMFVILDGELVVLVGRSQVEVARLGRGEVVGEMALFGVLDRRAATVRTLTACRILILDQNGLGYLRRKRSTVTTLLEEHALQVMAQRLRHTNSRVGHLAQGVALPERRGGLWGRVSSLLGGSRAAGAPPDVAALLATAPVFREYDPKVVYSLASHLRPVAVAEGEWITREGDGGDAAYIVASGSVGVYRAVGPDRYERLSRLREGSLFGVVALVDAGARSATCIAEEPSWVVPVPSAFLHGGAQVEPAEVQLFRRAVLEALAAHLRTANAHLEHLEQLRTQGAGG